MRKKAPRLAAAFVVTISAGCGGGTTEPVHPGPTAEPPTDTTKGTDDQSWVPNIGAIAPGILHAPDGTCSIQHPANPPWSERVDCETGKPLKPEEQQPVATPEKKPEADLPAAPKGWRVERTSDGKCTAYAPSDNCPEGMACNPPPPRAVKCP